MKGHILVSRLSNKSYYVSELDWDNAFKDKGNPKGLFKMLIEPIQNNDGVYEIKYMKHGDKYKISGESYIISANSESKIDKKIKQLRTKRLSFIQTKVETEDQLW